MVGVAIGVGAAATIGSTAVSMSAADKAAKTAKNTASENNALQQQIYNENEKTLAPFVQSGTTAGTAINALLGLGGNSSLSGGSGAALGGSPEISDGLIAQMRGEIGPKRTAKLNAYFAANPGLTNQQKVDYLTSIAHPDEAAKFTNLLSTAPRSTAPTPAQAASSAFDTFTNSDGYQFRLQQGQKSVQAALGAKGLLDSGAALKSLTTYGQGAASDEFGRYLGYLQGQQNVGLSAASAQAGVGQSYANAVSANNNQSAETRSTAALSGAQTITSSLNNVSQLAALGSSYGGGGTGVWSGSGAFPSAAYGWGS